MTKHTIGAWIFVAAACGGSAPRPTDAAAAAPSIAGRWQSDCVASPQADGSVQHLKLDFDLSDTDWSLDYVVHADESCTTPLVTVHVSGTYELGAPSSAVPGAWEARFGFDVKTIEPEVDGLRDALAAMPGCGAGDWQTGVAQDVYDTGCPGFGQYPRSRCQADYDLVLRDGETLRFGLRPADNDMCTPERRPTEASPMVLHRP